MLVEQKKRKSENISSEFIQKGRFVFSLKDFISYSIWQQTVLHNEEGKTLKLSIECRCASREIWWIPFIYFIVIILLAILVHGIEQRTKPTNIGMSHGLKMIEMEKNMKSISIGTLDKFYPSLNFRSLSFFICPPPIPSSQLTFGMKLSFYHATVFCQWNMFSWIHIPYVKVSTMLPVGHKAKKKNKMKKG